MRLHDEHLHIERFDIIGTNTTIYYIISLLRVLSMGHALARRRTESSGGVCVLLKSPDIVYLA